MAELARTQIQLERSETNVMGPPGRC
jgi:hypothetical protein